MTNSINFNNLPTDLQKEIKGTLRAYDKVDVYFENGKYHFGLVLKSHYADDHKVIGTYYAKDIFTEDERIENYINEFHSYPINYKGNRDYRMMKKMDNERIFNEDYTQLTHWIGKLINGNFELTEMVTVNI